MTCPNCSKEMTYDGADAVCPACGWRDLDVIQLDEPIVSDPADTLDSLVQQASIPNLASLFKQGKKAGLIQPGQEYSNIA